jgi:ATP-dependent DNA helicase RecG
MVLDGLKRPLAFAARNGFEHLGRVRDLGATLRSAADRVLGALPLGSSRRPAFDDWRRELERFEQAPREAQELLVARGLRLVAGLEGNGTKLLQRKEQDQVQDKVKDQVQEKRKDQGKDKRKDQGKDKRKDQGKDKGKDKDEGKDPNALTALPGCGPRTAELLAKGGIRTIAALLALLPRRYQDLRAVRTIAQLAEVPDGESVVVRGRVVRGRPVAFRFFDLTLEDPDTGDRLGARWFHFHAGLGKRFVPGQMVVLVGPVRRYKGELQLAHPAVLGGDEPGIRVQYPEIEGVAGRVVEKLCRAAALSYAPRAKDPIPTAIRQQHDLPALGEALLAVHAPPPDLAPAALRLLESGAAPAHRRLIFGEFLLLQLGIARKRLAHRQQPARPVASAAGAADALLALRPVLPFAPTRAQQRAVTEIARDLAGRSPMLRLLQGDVGSGKTMVAFAAAHLTLQAGFQVAVMAPTEILAEQHLRTMSPWAQALGWRTHLLTASTPRGVRESLLALAAAGEPLLIIGTHALLADRVSFGRLGLCIIDEQHRFGVAQRARLRDKGEGGAAPHLLVMTATPIPRSLALTAYGDLDLTVIDELPPGRTPPETRVFVGPRARKQAYRIVERELAAARQVYVVCPLVEESDKVDFAAAVSTEGELAQALPRHRVGLVHGRLSAAEKDDVMARFRKGEIDLLVATTVIEVGVDVPRASVMVVEHAERFGLAQLHQLRGRVGRAAGVTSRCLLLTPRAGSPTAAERLHVMATTTDGFRIAEADLTLRGFGELAGTRQAGAPRLADIARDLPLLAEARSCARDLLERDPALAHPEHGGLRAELERRAADPIYGEEAG